MTGHTKKTALHANWLGLFITGALLSIVSTASLHAEQIRFDSAGQWRSWELPLGAIELTPDGVIKPVEIRQNIDAVRNLDQWEEGGIRNAGSNRADAELIFDGDPTTGWGPDPADDPKDWFIELNLGRGVSAYRVTLVFDQAAPPFELFDLFLSTGEPETDNIAAPIPGSLVYRVKERFKENTKHRVTYQIINADEMPIQYVRF